MMKKKSLKAALALIVVIQTLFAASAFVAAAEDDLVYDNYDRGDLNSFGSSGALAAWAGGDAGKSASIEDNALKLEYGSEGWFGTGGGIDASEYNYLVVRVKGASGGEGDHFNLNYAVGDTVNQTGKTFTELSGKAITTSFQDIVIDLRGQSIHKGIQAFHFNFHADVSGTIWIDSITFTNSPPGGAASAPAASGDGGSAPAAEANPKTGVETQTALFAAMAAGALLLMVVLAAKPALARRK